MRLFSLSLGVVIFLTAQGALTAGESQNGSNPPVPLRPQPENPVIAEPKPPVTAKPQKPPFNYRSARTKMCRRKSQPENTTAVLLAIKWPTLACTDSTPIPINRNDCMVALGKIKATKAHLNHAVEEWKTCRMELESTYPFDMPIVKDLMEDRYGVGVEAMVDTCCPLGLDWPVRNIRAPGADDFFRVIVTRPEKPTP